MRLRAVLLIMVWLGTAPVSARTLRLIYNNVAGSAMDQASHQLSATVARLSHGRLRILVYPGAVWHGKHLGELGVLQTVHDGQLEMGVVTSAPLVNYDPAFQLLDAPFLFDTYAEADKALDGPAGQHLLASLPAHGLQGLAFWDAGFRMLALTHPWHGLKGQRVRVMENPMYEAVMKLLGARPVPSDIERVVPMLKEGYIDAVDTAYAPFLQYHMDQVSRYILESRHSYAAKVVFMNLATFKRLSRQEQNWLIAGATDMRGTERRLSRQEEDTTRAQCRARGVQVIPLSASDRSAMRKACQPVYDALNREFTAPWQKALLVRNVR